MVVGGGEVSSSARGCVALGPAWMSERRLRISSCVEIVSAVLVSAMVARATWSSTRLWGAAIGPVWLSERRLRISSCVEFVSAVLGVGYGR